MTKRESAMSKLPNVTNVPNTVVIAPGDEVKARLRIYRRKDAVAGVYVNFRYEVTEVISHKPAKSYVQSEIR